jgi:transcriptional regulator with XRE-family HTH domain
MDVAKKMRNALEREDDLRETAALYLRGLTQAEVAHRLNVSRQQIGYDLKVLQKRWQESALADFDAKKAAELAKMDELERTYWEAWERSCQTREVTTQERTQGGEGQEGDGRLKAGVRKEQRDGNPEFLRGIERRIEMRCKIIGAFAAVKIAPTTPDGEEAWHASDNETNAVLLAAFARLGLAAGTAGDPGTFDDLGQALASSGIDSAAGGNDPGPLADAGSAESASPDPAPLFETSR